MSLCLSSLHACAALQNSGVLSDLGLDLLQKLLTPDPQQRISAAAALQHEYFKEFPKTQPTELMPSYPDTNNQGIKRCRCCSCFAAMGAAVGAAIFLHTAFPAAAAA